MRYLGGKSKIARPISAIINSHFAVGGGGKFNAVPRRQKQDRGANRRHY